MRQKSALLHIVNPSHRPPPAPKKVPKPAAVMPECPAHLSDAARRFWNSLGRKLFLAGMLAETDGVALERAAEAYAEVCELQGDLRAYAVKFPDSAGGRTQIVPTKGGSDFERQRPTVGMLQDADRRLKLWLLELGATPAARSKVTSLLDDDSEGAKDPGEKYGF